MPFTDWARPGQRLCVRSHPEFRKLSLLPRQDLAAAIPAVIAYNLIIGSIREMASRNDDFALEMLNLIERPQVQPLSEVRR